MGSELHASFKLGSGDEYLALIDQFDGSERTWTAVSGRIYSAYWTDDLQQLFVLMVEDSPGGSYLDSQSATHPVGYYQIKVRMD